MANGDAAAAAGMDVVPGTADLREGYDEDNKTRDYLAGHQTTGTHDAAAIASGVLNAARIPPLAGLAGTLDGSKVTGTVPAAAYAEGANYSNQSGLAVYANGPSVVAYNRASTGSGWVGVWMNSALEFMRNTSSRRYKKNIRNWTGTTRGLRTVIFDRKGDDTPDDEVGFIAEEVLESLPEAVVYFDGKIDGINDRVILAALVADVQRLTALVEGSAE